MARTIIEMFQRDLGNQRGSVGGGKKPPGEPMGYDRYKKRFGNEPVEVPEDPEGLRMYLDRMLKRADRPLPHLQQMLDNWEDTKSYQPYLDRLKQYRDEEALEGPFAADAAVADAVQRPPPARHRLLMPV